MNEPSRRLTQRTEHGILRICPFGHEEHRCFGCSDRTRCNATIFERLAHYEDMEEQGRILIPPFHIGDTVWVIDGRWVSEYTVISFFWDGVFFQFRAENKAYAKDCRYFSFFDERIGKTVFPTKEDAENFLERWKQQ